MSTYRALVVREEGERFTRKIEEVPFSFLPESEVLIKVSYAGLNYKDALSASGHKGITRSFPHTPGVDASGIVEKSSSSEFKSGQEVIVTSFDLGMNTKGAFAEYICVPAGWVVPLPEGLSLKDAMIMGTAALLPLWHCTRWRGQGRILIWENWWLRELRVALDPWP